MAKLTRTQKYADFRDSLRSAFVEEEYGEGEIS